MSLQQLVCDGEPLPNDAKVPVPADLHLVLISSEGATDEQKKDMTNELVLYANEGEVDVVRLLLKAGVDPDGLDDYLDTALVNASFYGYLEVVRMLLGARASTTAREERRPATCQGIWQRTSRQRTYSVGSWRGQRSPRLPGKICSFASIASGHIVSIAVVALPYI